MFRLFRYGSLGAAGLVILIRVVIVASDRIIERWYKWSGRPFTVSTASPTLSGSLRFGVMTRSSAS